MFSCCLKQSYGRAVELDDSRVFALIESGNISLMLGSSRKVIHHSFSLFFFFPPTVLEHPIPKLIFRV